MVEYNFSRSIMKKAFEELYEALDGVIDVSVFLPGFVRMLIDNKDLIVSWVKSKEFKEKYANHPYPPLLNPNVINYQEIPTEFAWELNLPLPSFFDFLFLRSHGGGATGMNAFLEKCGHKLISASNIMDGREAYCEIYNQLIKNSHQNLYVMLADYVMRGDSHKYFALIPNKPAFYLVRDPIGALKHYLSIKRPAGGGGYYLT